MAYATVADVQARLSRALSESEQNVAGTLLDDAAALIDAYNAEASMNAKKVVSCSMVVRAIGDGSGAGVPIGATQGSMSALGYAQSWTIGNGGSTQELYLSKANKALLGISDNIGSYSPVQALACKGGDDYD